MIVEKRVLSTSELKAFKVFVNCLKQSGSDRNMFLFEIKLIEKWRF